MTVWLERSMRWLGTLAIGAMAIFATAPASAGVIDTPTCKRALASVAAPVKVAAQACSANRQSLMDTVRMRAVVAACKNGLEREQDVARLDGQIETINVAVADTCRDS
jgi:hypothetical protein